MNPQQISEAKAYIESQISFTGSTGIILGTGLGGLIHKIDIEKSSFKEFAQLPERNLYPQ